jgi:serine/threonine protein kinase
MLIRPFQRGEWDFEPVTPETSRIGPYKLLQRIGEGGCGVVYMAEQDEPIRRRVALKIIKLGMDTKNVIARFEAERQALALMDHPNIARVLDAGASESGRPYFVMELVYGVKITEYCDQNCVSMRERLDLFHSGLQRGAACPPKGHHSSRPQALQRHGHHA